MMVNHTFILSPGLWSGEGKIIMNMIDEELLFTTEWVVQQPDFSGKVECMQTVQIQGLSESMNNELTFYNFQPKQFSVDMENQNIGQIAGCGVIDEKMIAWEFRNPEMQFEGYETYLLQEDGSYLMRGEYITSDHQFRTQIEARLWAEPRQLPPSSNESQENGEV
ncbi:MAG: hypothetical protein Q8L98_07770 [Chlamydiales bacterium]|nr:hypothetical protein [Chlamydiales bacterium]